VVSATQRDVRSQATSSLLSGSRAGHDDANLPTRVWKYIKEVLGANEELVRLVVTGLKLAAVNQVMDAY